MIESGPAGSPSHVGLSTFKSGNCRLLVVLVCGLLLGLGMALLLAHPAVREAQHPSTHPYRRDSEAQTGPAALQQLAQLTQELRDSVSQLKQQQQHLGQQLGQQQQQQQAAGTGPSSEQIAQLSKELREGVSQLKQGLQAQLQQLQEQEGPAQHKPPVEQGAGSWPTDGADPNGNSCSNGFFTSPRKLFWSYVNATAMSLSEVYHAEDRIYAVFNYKIQPPHSDHWKDLINGDWTFEFLGAPALGLPAKTVKAYDLGRDGHGMTHTVTAALPKEYLAAPRDRPLRMHVTLKHPKEVKRYENVPFCLRPDPSPFRHLVLCTEMQAGPAAQVPEWVAYHQIQGVEHFFLYINDDLTKVRQHLEPLVKRGLVTVIDWQWPEQYRGHHQFQQAEQNGCLMRMRGQARWVALTDVDEFVQSMVPGMNVAEFLHKANVRDHVGSLIAQSTWWGSSSNDTLQAQYEAAGHGLMLGRFRSRGKVEGRKMIANPRGMSYNSVHGITTGGPEHVLDPEKELRLNHFKPHMKLDTADGSLWEHGDAVRARLKEWGYPTP